MINRIKPVWFLVLGIAVLTATHLSFNVDMLAWVSSVPFLIYLGKTKGMKSRWLFVLALIIAWSFITAKIITPPIPYIMIFLYSIPISLFHLPGYLLWDRFKEHPWSFLLFPSVMTIMEWIQYTFTPFASWGVAAYTQNSLSVMQSVSLFGMAGLSFVIYWINISITEVALKRKPDLLTFQVPLAALLILVIFGAFRFDLSKAIGTNTITVAAVGTDSDVAGLPLPPPEVNELVNSALFERTRTSAKCNAKLVVWNEAATFCLAQTEPAWKDSLSALAKELKIFLVASYVMPVSESPFKYENKYLIIDPKGAFVYSYHKHQPVPGEPAIKGKERLEVVDMDGSKIGGSICYDYDFPYLAREFGKLNADIIAVPSSDWRGIDPLHTRMAAFRAVEQGHSILRSTRFGLSAAITPYGEMTSQMSSFDNNNKIMIAHLPANRVTTLYSIIGDSFVYLCFGFTAFVFWFVARSKKSKQK
jgi:apolipoprotein N-acyltransferase